MPDQFHHQLDVFIHLLRPFHFQCISRDKLRDIPFIEISKPIFRWHQVQCLHNRAGVLRKMILKASPEKIVFKVMLSFQYCGNGDVDIPKVFCTAVHTQCLRFKSLFKITADIDVIIPFTQVILPFLKFL